LGAASLQKASWLVFGLPLACILRLLQPQRMETRMLSLASEKRDGALDYFKTY
jgi:hypothetical protein